MKLSAQISFSKKISHLDRLMFTKHLSTMIKAGIPLVEAIQTLRDQGKAPILKNTLTQVSADIENGLTLAKSLAKHEQSFDQFYLSLVEVGEESGTLEQNLEFLAEQLKKDFDLRKKIQGAMLYPAIIFFAMIIMGGFISLAVLPKLVGFFEAFDVELPLTTKILLFFANFMEAYGVIFFISLIGFFVLLRMFLNSKKVKPWWHKTLLKIPLFGEMTRNGQISRFSRNLGMLTKSGVPIIKSLETTADTLSNLKFKADVKKISKALSEGKNIGSVMEKVSMPEFPPLVAKMVAVGEKTGKLEDTLLYLAEFYEEEIDNISKNLTAILEPVLLLGIGLVVGFVALAIISPIYELTGSFRR